MAPPHSPASTQLAPPASKKRKLSSDSSSFPAALAQSAPSPSNHLPASPMTQNSPAAAAMAAAATTIANAIAPAQANSPLPQAPLTPQAAQASAASAMPPPSSTSPIQKPVDTNDLQDVLFSSGVNLREEEQALVNLTTPAGSFNQSFSLSAMNLASSIETSMGDSGEFDTQAAKMAEERQRAQEDSKTRHQNGPFLERAPLLSRIRSKLESSQLKTVGDTTELEVLLSLAMVERVKDLVGTAYTLSNHRRNGGPQGLGEWADMAIGEGESRRGLGGEAESAVTPGVSNPRKRSFSQANGSNKPTLISESAKSLRAMATKEREAEEARIAARNQKHQGSSSKVQTPGSEDVAMTSPMGAVAPEPEARKLSVKEARKINQSKKDEVLSHQAANATASLMLGGGKKKKYSWMTAGATPSPSPLPGKSAPGTPAATTPRPQTMYWGKRIGEWNEQGDRGRGIQLRDWAQTLEIDGRDQKAVVKAYMKMK